MSNPLQADKNDQSGKAPLPLWLAIVLVIILMFAVVGLFGALIFLLVSGAQQAGWSPVAYLVIFVVVSGLFAWLLKRLANVLLGISRMWFSDEADDRS